MQPPRARRPVQVSPGRGAIKERGNNHVIPVPARDIGALVVVRSQVSVEVMDVLMKYGTAGVAGLVLRREFVEAVEVLKRLSGVDK